MDNQELDMTARAKLTGYTDGLQRDDIDVEFYRLIDKQMEIAGVDDIEGPIRRAILRWTWDLIDTPSFATEVDMHQIDTLVAATAVMAFFYGYQVAMARGEPIVKLPSRGGEPN